MDKSNQNGKSIAFFQDYFSQNDKSEEKESSNTACKIDPAEAFFELANAPKVGYRLTKSNSAVVVSQDNSCQTHTGGIVWETSYLLALFLQNRYHNLGKLLEVGSGCGMLGLVLASSELCSKVVCTETTEVMPALKQNVVDNCHTVTDDNTSSEDKESVIQKPCAEHLISARCLRWDKLDSDIKKCKSENSSDLDEHSFDTIVGTDVIFSTKLVKPLLKTIRKMAHARTRILLCVQVRCADAHAKFMKKANTYDLECNEVTSELNLIPSFSWGLDLECKILRLSVRVQKTRKRKGLEKVSKKRRKKSRY